VHAGVNKKNERVQKSACNSRIQVYLQFEHVQILISGGTIMYVAAVYFSYLLITVVLTMWVARTLFRSGRVFLLDAFAGNEALADSVNHLLVVGFYLINIGYIALALKTTSSLSTLREVIELESGKIGVVLLILGGMHFFNIAVLARMRGRRNHIPVAQVAWPQ
jgi:hypothetical protein